MEELLQEEPPSNLIPLDQDAHLHSYLYLSKYAISLTVDLSSTQTSLV